jgi:CBS domain-containing protein
MDREPPLVPAGQTVAQAAEAIRRGEPLYCRRQALLPADPSGRLIGLATRGDLLRELELRNALTRMLITNVGRRPVVDGQGRAVGYLGRVEVLVARRKHHEEEHTRKPGWLGGGRKRRPWAGPVPSPENPS